MTIAAVRLVEEFYHTVWNKADEEAARRVLSADFRFRGSLGPEKYGPDGFIAYMRSVHRALGGYICVIEEVVADGDRVAARMRFRGRHQAEFFGVAATGRDIEWAGAAFFRVDQDRIAELWVLGDIDSVKQQLGQGTSAGFTVDEAEAE